MVTMKKSSGSQGSSLDYMTAIKSDSTLLKKSFLISVLIHAFLLMVVFPSTDIGGAGGDKDEDLVITQYTPPPPKKKEPKKRKVLVKKTFAVIPDPTPNEPEPAQDYAFEDDDESPLDEDDFLFVPDGDQGPIRADGVRVKMPKCRKILPKYPDLARKARIKGVVVLQVIIDTNGRITQARVISSPGVQFGFDAAALEAVKKWRCEPATLDGRKVEITGSITVNFVLN